MDIEYPRTPPKQVKGTNEFSTPKQKTTPKDTQTPKKSRVTFESPQPHHSNKIISTPPKNSMTEKSRKLTKNSSNSPRTPYKSPADELAEVYEGFNISDTMNMNQNENIQEITPFYLPRLQADYKFIRYLGLGNFSRVALYQSRLTRDQYAIKSTDMSLMSVNQVQALGTLSSIFSQTSHHIVKYYHSWIQQSKIYIVMQYCQSSLKEVYQFCRIQGKIIQQERLKEMMKQSLIGIKAMHQCNMVHLDIKPDNLLLKQGEVKVADLGLCRITRIKRWSDLDEGDTRYLAKEVLNYHEGVDLTRADIYSLGMSIFQGAILEDLPNNGEEWLDIRDNGVNLKQIPQIQHYSAEFKEILGYMLHPNWQARPSCEELLAHKYFADTNKTKRQSRFMRGNGKSSRKQEGSL